MPYELDYTDPTDVLEIAYGSDALFEQYDDADNMLNAADDGYENLYPAIS